jgi:hypothetical protein
MAAASTSTSTQSPVTPAAVPTTTIAANTPAASAATAAAKSTADTQSSDQDVSFAKVLRDRGLDSPEKLAKYLETVDSKNKLADAVLTAKGDSMAAEAVQRFKKLGVEMPEQMLKTMAHEAARGTNANSRLFYDKFLVPAAPEPAAAATTAKPAATTANAIETAKSMFRQKASSNVASDDVDDKPASEADAEQIGKGKGKRSASSEPPATKMLKMNASDAERLKTVLLNFDSAWDETSETQVGHMMIPFPQTSSSSSSAPSAPSSAPTSLF